MGLADLILGKQNPFAQYVGENRNSIRNAFAGFGQGTDIGSGLANAAIGARNGAPADTAANLLQQEQAKQQEALNKTTEWLRQNGQTQLLAAVEAGAMSPSEAWSMALQSQQGAKPIEINGQLVDPSTGQVIGDYRSPEQPAFPASYQEYLLAQNDPGYAASRATQGGPMNSTVQQAILGADEVAASSEASIGSLNRALELNQQAYDGPFAEQRASTSALFGDPNGQATLELKNIVTANALESLKATFGAAPTEGERKILLDIQGSVDQPKAVREAIFKRAIEAANRRIASNRQKAEGLRSGGYFAPGYGQQPTGNTTSTGLSWSIEP